MKPSLQTFHEQDPFQMLKKVTFPFFVCYQLFRTLVFVSRQELLLIIILFLLSILLSILSININIIIFSDINWSALGLYPSRPRELLNGAEYPAQVLLSPTMEKYF